MDNSQNAHLRLRGPNKLTASSETCVEVSKLRGPRSCLLISRAHAPMSLILMSTFSTLGQRVSPRSRTRCKTETAATNRTTLRLLSTTKSNKMEEPPSASTMPGQQREPSACPDPTRRCKQLLRPDGNPPGQATKKLRQKRCVCNNRLGPRLIRTIQLTMSELSRASSPPK
ncbi:hypothetical protein BV898_19872, partial [Hypsibius exemplaris]